MSAFLLAAIYGSAALVAAAIAWGVSSPERRWYNVAHWMIGVTLTVTLTLLTTMIALTAECARRTDAGLLDLRACGENLQAWFSVVQSWQQGIGAAVGLLGLGWATHFNAARIK